MLRYLFILHLFAIVLSCSKKEDIKIMRSNFAELTIDGNRIVFNKLEAIVDTSTDAIGCQIKFEDTLSNSYMLFNTVAGFRSILHNYQWPGESFPGPSLSNFILQTYINKFSATYVVQNTMFSVTIDSSKNGRMHGTFSGKVICYSCYPYTESNVTNGEFELPYQ